MIPIGTAGDSLPAALRSVGLVPTCLAAMLVLLSDTSRATDCKLTRLASVDLTTLNNRLVVAVAVNDHPARMWLDVSDIATSISAEYVKPLGLKVHPLPAGATVNFGKSRITQSAALTAFALGSLRFRTADFFVIPSDRTPSADSEPIIGRLGMDALGKVDFELDFANGKLNLYSQDHCPGAVVYWTSNYSSARITRGPLGNYYFPIELEGKKVEASISTINAGTSLPVEVTRRLYGFDEKSKGIETQTDSTGQTIAHYRAMALTGNGISIKNAQIELNTGGLDTSCKLTTHDGAAQYVGCMGGEPPLLLGLNVARHLHLFFATKEKVLYFSDAVASK